MAKEFKNYRSIDCSKYNFDLIDYRDKKEIEEILLEYACRISEPTADEAEAIMEQYNIIKARRLPAKEWIVKIICELSKKDKSKQCVQYLIGIIRNRINYGWGTLRSAEEILITQKVEEMLGFPMSVTMSEHIYSLMGNYGATRIAFALHRVNMEEIILKELIDVIENQFPQKGDDQWN